MFVIKNKLIENGKLQSATLYIFFYVSQKQLRSNEGFIIPGYGSFGEINQIRDILPILG